MNSFGRLLATLLALSAPVWAVAQQPPPIKVVTLAELSGGGAAAGTNFKNGVELAFQEINAAGGILGRPVELVSLDTQTDPAIAKAKAREAVDMGAYAVLGPVFSGSVLESMQETRRAQIPNFVGAEATGITLQGNPYVFRTSFTQAAAMPRLARYIRTGVRAKSVAMIWVNNDFGKGGRDAMSQALAAEGVKVAASVSTEPQQADFAEAVRAVKASKADAVFVYLNEDESVRCLQELRKQDYAKPVVGETTLLGQKVLAQSGEAADGVLGHVGLTPDALVPTIRAFDNKFLRTWKTKSDHNGMKGYVAAYLVKAVTEKVGKADPKAFAAAMKGLSITAKDEPGILLDVRYDDKGDLDRDSFIVRAMGGRHQFITRLSTVPGKK